MAGLGGKGMIRSKTAAIVEARRRWGKQAYLCIQRNVRWLEGQRFVPPNEYSVMGWPSGRQDFTVPNDERIEVADEFQVGFSIGSPNFRVNNILGHGRTWDEAFQKADERTRR
jgi:hypothetical protein